MHPRVSQEAVGSEPSAIMVDGLRWPFNSVRHTAIVSNSMKLKKGNKTSQIISLSVSMWNNSSILRVHLAGSTRVNLTAYDGGRQHSGHTWELHSP